MFRRIDVDRNVDRRIVTQLRGRSVERRPRVFQLFSHLRPVMYTQHPVLIDYYQGYPGGGDVDGSVERERQLLPRRRLAENRQRDALGRLLVDFGYLRGE